MRSARVERTFHRISTDSSPRIRPTDCLFTKRECSLCYRWLIGGAEPLPVALSNVEQHSWLGYYIQDPPTARAGPARPWQRRDGGSFGESVELRLSRSLGYGLHEDVDLTNFTQQPSRVRLQPEGGCRFRRPGARPPSKRSSMGDSNALGSRNQQRQLGALFRLRCPPSLRDTRGMWATQPSIAPSPSRSPSVTSEPQWSGIASSFRYFLRPMQSWHACIRMHPNVEDEPAFPLYDCYAFQPTSNFCDEHARGISRPGTTVQRSRKAGR